VGRLACVCLREPSVLVFLSRFRLDEEKAEGEDGEEREGDERCLVPRPPWSPVCAVLCRFEGKPRIICRGERFYERSFFHGSICNERGRIGPCPSAGIGHPDRAQVKVCRRHGVDDTRKATTIGSHHVYRSPDKRPGMRIVYGHGNSPLCPDCDANVCDAVTARMCTRRFGAKGGECLVAGVVVC